MTDADLHADVELEATSELIPYSNNPKEHPDAQVKKIASSIKNYGWDQPIVVDGDGEIIKGHGRLQAADLLGLEEVPVIRREDLSSAEAKASRIADNRTAESEWADETLAAELDVLTDDIEIEIDSLGFDDDEIEDLLDLVAPPEPDFDEGEELTDEEDDAMNVVIVAETEAEAEAIGEWADANEHEWHVVDK